MQVCAPLAELHTAARIQTDTSAQSFLSPSLHGVIKFSCFVCAVIQWPGSDVVCSWLWHALTILICLPLHTDTLTRMPEHTLTHMHTYLDIGLYIEFGHDSKCFVFSSCRFNWVGKGKWDVLIQFVSRDGHTMVLLPTKSWHFPLLFIL